MLFGSFQRRGWFQNLIHLFFPSVLPPKSPSPSPAIKKLPRVDSIYDDEEEEDNNEDEMVLSGGEENVKQDKKTTGGSGSGEFVVYCIGF